MKDYLCSHFATEVILRHTSNITISVAEAYIRARLTTKPSNEWATKMMGLWAAFRQPQSSIIAPPVLAPAPIPATPPTGIHRTGFYGAAFPSTSFYSTGIHSPTFRDAAFRCAS